MILILSTHLYLFSWRVKSFFESDQMHQLHFSSHDIILLDVIFIQLNEYLFRSYVEGFLGLAPYSARVPEDLLQADECLDIVTCGVINIHTYPL